MLVPDINGWYDLRAFQNAGQRIQTWKIDFWFQRKIEKFAGNFNGSNRA